METKGYSFDCNNCDKTFHTRTSLRMHVRKCTNNHQYIEEKKEILAKEDGGLFETQGASLMNYDEKVSALMEKNDRFWVCKVCPYNSTKQHLTEHVGKHIKGYSFECTFCHKSHNTKVALRGHLRKCTMSN